MRCIVRTAGTNDVPAMHRVRTMVRENRLSSPKQVSEASYLPYVQVGSVWVAETETRVVGFAAVDAPAKRVWALFIDPDAEGRGIGQALLRRMLSWAQERRLERLTLSTDRGTRAAQFYAQAVWAEAGTTSDGEAIFELILPS